MTFDIHPQHFWAAMKSPLAHFVAALALLLFTCAVTIGMIVGEWSDLSDAQEGLARLQRRAPTPQVSTDAAGPPGSPFLEGDSATVASAALLQRVTSLITQLGGTVASSEVDPQNGSTKDGWLKVSATGTLELNALQQLLYELEAGMPFLYVEQLSAQVEGETGNDRPLRVSVAVAGLWRAK